MNNDEIEKARIRWRCKRGMLELDLILLTFFESYYDTLNKELQIQFKQLLQFHDPEIYSYLLGFEETPIDKEIVPIVHHIKARM